MSTSLRYETAPAMWAVERPAAAGDGAVLRIGRHRVRARDIRSVERHEETERDINGLIVMGMAFLVASTIFVVGVVDIGWRTRFLLGAGFLLALAFVSLTETMSIRPVRFVRLRIATADGEVLFTTADPADATALEERIGVERQAFAAAAAS